MSQRRSLLVSEEPRISRLLRARQRLFVPDNIHAWAVDYLEDAEALLRSRSYRVNFLATIIGKSLVSALLARPFTGFPVIRQSLGAN